MEKFSRPFFDRMDICIETAPVSFRELAVSQRKESSKDIKERVERAHEIQKKRYQNEPFRYNGELGAREIKKYCAIRDKESDFMEAVFQKLGISARAYHKILKTARTIADLEGGGEIGISHLSEAVCYRMADQKYWMKKE